MRRVLSARGALEHDREFAIFDATVSGQLQANSRITALETRFQPATASVKMAVRGFQRLPRVSSRRRSHPIEAWLSGFFDMPVHLRRHSSGGFPDDSKSPGPRLSATKTIREVASCSTT